VLTGTSESVSHSSFELAQRHEGLFSTAGVHPHYASSCDDKTLEHLRELLTHERVVAVGECGLDYNRDRSPRDVQRKWFEAQLELSQACGKPLFLHERDAADDMIALLTKQVGFAMNAAANIS